MFSSWNVKLLQPPPLGLFPSGTFPSFLKLYRYLSSEPSKNALWSAGKKKNFNNLKIKQTATTLKSIFMLLYFQTDFQTEKDEKPRR